MSTFFQQTAQAMIAKHIDRFPLLKLDQVIDWQPIEQYLNRQRTRYLRDHRGRPAYPLLSMFKAVLLGQWHSLSDPELEHSLITRIDFNLFCRFDELSIPDYSTLCRYRNWLAQDNTLSELLELINRQLTEKNLKVEKASAAVIDATIIQTAGSKQRQAIEVDEEGQVSGQTTPSKDKDARWTKKNGLYKLGYKQHTRTDEEGYIEKLHITPANTHECKHLSPLLEGIALAAAAFMLRQGGAVVEAFVHVLAGGLGRTTKGALIEAVAAFQAAAVAGTDTHAAGAVAAFVAEVFKKGAADIGVDASGMGLGTVQHGIALAAELQFVGLQ